MRLQKSIQKSKRFLITLRKWIAHSCFVCPSCGEEHSIVVDRKKLITTLRRCNNCKLLFRTPTTTKEENENHYNEGGDFDFASKLPSAKELKELIKRNFKDTEGDCSSEIQVLKALGCKKGERLLDFGCAWGYRSWQLSQAGYTVQTFEISKPSCNYARENLGVDAYSSWDELTNPVDIFFSTHVLEHVPGVREIIEKGWQILRPGGLFIAFTPNGSSTFREKDPSTWHSLWGSGHPNFLDELYYDKVFDGFPRLITSTTLSPYPEDELKKWDQTNTSCRIIDLSGVELLIAVRKPKK